MPIYQTSSYVFKDTKQAADRFGLREFGPIYTRIGNPTVAVLEERIAELEGGAGAVATASGASAILLAITNIVRSGDHIVSSASLYGGTYNLLHYTLDDLGIKTTFVDPSDPENFRKAIQPNTKLVFAETLGNPKNDVLDFEKVAAVAHEAGLPLVIDNTVGTPYLVRPFEWGADIVIHSLTKYIGGHGTTIAGIVVDSGKFNWGNGKFTQFTEVERSYHGLVWWNLPEPLKSLSYILRLRTIGLRDLGPALSPLSAQQILLGTETLSLRVQRHSDNALKVAKWLEVNPLVTWVNYPGLESHPTYKLGQKYLPKGQSGIIGFGIKGGREAGAKFINSVELLSHLANIGDAKSLVIHPATTTHSQLSPEELLDAGVTEDFVRLSIGLEDVSDIIADIQQALEKSQA